VAGVDLSAAVAVQPWLPRRTSRALVPMMPSRRQPRQCTSKKNRRGSPAVDVTVADAQARISCEAPRAHMPHGHDAAPKPTPTQPGVSLDPPPQGVNRRGKKNG